MKPYHLCKPAGIRLAFSYETGDTEFYAVAGQLSDFATPEATMRTATYILSLEDQMRLQTVDLLAIDVSAAADLPAWCTSSPAMRFVFKNGKFERRMRVPKKQIEVYASLL